MSYNCNRWKTKELIDLRIPVSSLFKHVRNEWHPTQQLCDDGTVCFQITEGSRIVGRIERDWLLVSDITATGEGSGTALSWIIEPALSDSTGRLVAVRIWECGDSVDRLTVDGGTVTREEVEL